MLLGSKETVISCKLCSHNKPLIRSHLIAKRIYALVGTEQEEPIIINSRVIMHSSRQTKDFLHQNLYFSSALEPEKDDAERIITDLFALWMKHPEKLPESYQEKAEAEPLARIVCDYIAGMTDTYISEQYEKHCG